MSIFESHWYAAGHASNPTACSRLTRRELRDAGRLLASHAGDPTADAVTAELHRSGFDLRADDGRSSLVFLLLGLLVMVVSAAWIVWTLMSSPGGWR